MHNNTPPGHARQTTTNPYRPSVPISVYRELAAELQATQAMLDSLNAQNQQLVQQNQLLRQEVEKAVHSAIYMQQVVASLKPVRFGEASSTSTYPEEHREFNQASHSLAVRRSRQTTAIAPVEAPAPLTFSEKLYTEQQEPRNRRPAPPESASEISGLWLAVAIVAIVLTAFGTGFLIVRPLLNGR
ncbi:MAG TPA: hypothetical protein V6D15_07160 [Oculatellaceae cyanobacterium]|jgi:hypothetical protein